MKTAYDMSMLVAKLKARGLDLAEDAAKNVVEDVVAWIQESALLSETPWDNMALVVLPELKKLALAEVDKIDGKVG